MDPQKYSFKIPIIIGIAGISRSGKTTLSKQLAEYYKIEKILHMDDFLIHKGIIKEDKNWPEPIKDWEDSACYDLDKFKQTIEDIKKSKNINNKIIVVEGFLLYLRKDISDLVDCKIYLEVDKEIARERRKSSKYYHSDYYFDDYIWKVFHESLYFLISFKNLL